MAVSTHIGDDKITKGRLADWLVVALLMAAMLTSFLDRFALSLLMEPVKQDLALNDIQVGLLNGIAFGLFYALMGLPFGWLADRWSRRNTILVGMLAWSAATFGCGLSTNFTQLLIARMGVGAGEAGLQPASYGIIHDRFPTQMLGRAMSLLQVGAMIGVGGAMMLAGVVFSFFSSGAGDGIPLMGGLAAWQQTFIVIALPPLLLLPFVARLREDRPKMQSPAERLSLLSAIKLHPVTYSAVFLTIAMVMTATYALLNWVPSVLAREYSWSPGAVGATYGPAVMVTGTIGLLGGGWLADLLVKRGTKGAHLLVMLVTPAATLPIALMLPFVESAAAIIVLATIMQGTLAMAIGVAPAYLQILSPASTRGQIAALYHLILNVVGFGVGTTLIGILSSRAASEASGLRVAVSQVLIGACVIGIISMLTLVWVNARAPKRPTKRFTL